MFELIGRELSLDSTVRSGYSSFCSETNAKALQSPRALRTGEWSIQYWFLMIKLTGTIADEYSSIDPEIHDGELQPKDARPRRRQVRYVPSPTLLS